MASDAFFPFADSVEIAHEAGITAVIQPGGSVRDQIRSIIAGNMIWRWFLQEFGISNIRFITALTENIKWDFLFTKEIAIDLGTANTIIIYNDKVVVDEPSIVAMERNSGKDHCSRKESHDDAWQDPRKYQDHPSFARGVIADFHAAEIMIREMIKMIGFRKTCFLLR